MSDENLFVSVAPANEGASSVDQTQVDNNQVSSEPAS